MLAHGAGVDGNGHSAGLLDAADDVEDVDGAFVPADARLDGDRNLDGLDGAVHGLIEPVEVAQVRGAGAFLDDARHRAAKVDVDDLGSKRFQTMGAGGDQIGVVAVDLGSYQRDAGFPVDFGVGEVEQVSGLVGVVVDIAAVDELDADDAGSQTGADEPEDAVAHPGHRRQGEHGHVRFEGGQGVGAESHCPESVSRLKTSN